MWFKTTLDFTKTFGAVTFAPGKPIEVPDTNGTLCAQIDRLWWVEQCDAPAKAAPKPKAEPKPPPTLSTGIGKKRATKAKPKGA